MDTIIRKPIIEDIPEIRQILTQWTESIEVEKYCQRLLNEINNKIEFNQHFWVITNGIQVIGVGGLANPLPKIKSFIQTTHPVELKILYLDNQSRGRGLGLKLFSYIESQAKTTGSLEMLIRTAKRYKDTAWGFYQKQGYNLAGYVDDDMAVFHKFL